MACQKAIKRASLNASKAVVPYRPAARSGADYLVSWSGGSGLQLMNGFGAMLDASASCIYNASSRNVTALSINGKSLID